MDTFKQFQSKKLSLVGQRAILGGCMGKWVCTTVTKTICKSFLGFKWDCRTETHTYCNCEKPIGAT